MYTSTCPGSDFDMSRLSLDGSSQAGIKSGYDQGAKAPEDFCGGRRAFYLVSVCACFMPCTMNRGMVLLYSSQSYVVISAWFVRTYECKCGHTYPGAQNG